MAGTWRTLQNRKWEASKLEKDFLRLVDNGGYTVVGIREYQEFADYNIYKAGVSQVFRVFHTNGVKAEDIFNTFERFYNIKVEYTKMLAEYNQEFDD